MIKFEDGQKLTSIIWDTGGGESTLEVDTAGCLDIEVSMENGQMAAVPWAVAKMSDGRIFKHNLALASSVLLAITTYDLRKEPTP